MSEAQFSYRAAVERAAAGDQQAFEFLYKKTYQNKLYLAIRYMKNQEEAEDVLQEAYMKAWSKLGELGDPEKFPSWLGMIVANTAKDAIKAKKPYRFSSLEEENEDGEAYMLDIPDERIESQPELAFEEKERSMLLKSLTDSLTEEQNMAITMYYIEQYSVKEIAEVMGCSENTVKSRLNYGRKNLKARVEELRKKGWPLFGIAAIPLFLHLTAQEAYACGCELTFMSALSGAAKAAHAAQAAGTAKAAGTARTAGTAGRAANAAKATKAAAAAKTAVAGKTAAAAGATAKASAVSMTGVKVALLAVAAAAGVGAGVGAGHVISERMAEPTAVYSEAEEPESEIRSGKPEEKPAVTAAPEETAAPETPAPEEFTEAKLIDKEDLSSLLVNDITAEECEVLLGNLPASEISLENNEDALKAYIHLINTGYYELGITDTTAGLNPKAVYNNSRTADVALGEYNKYVALGWDIELTSSNIDSYRTSFDGEVTKIGGEWYVPWEGADYYPNGLAQITSVVQTDVCLYIYYLSGPFVAGFEGDLSESGADAQVRVATLYPVNQTGRYRISDIGLADGTPTDAYEKALKDN